MSDLIAAGVVSLETARAEPLPVLLCLYDALNRREARQRLGDLDGLNAVLGSMMNREAAASGFDALRAQLASIAGEASADEAGEAPSAGYTRSTQNTTYHEL